MTTYEKALELLNCGIARKHYTFKNVETGCIIIDLDGTYVGFISPFDEFVDIFRGAVHVSYGIIDLENMTVIDMSNIHHYSHPIKKPEDSV